MEHAGEEGEQQPEGLHPSGEGADKSTKSCECETVADAVARSSGGGDAGAVQQAVQPGRLNRLNVVARKQDQQGGAADEGIRLGADPAEADADAQEVGIAEEEYGRIPKAIVDSDLSELCYPMPICIGDQPEENINERHHPRIEVDAQPFVEIVVDPSVDSPVDRDVGREVVVGEVRCCEGKQNG